MNFHYTPHREVPRSRGVRYNPRRERAAAFLALALIGRPPMRRILPALLWLVLIYVVTLLAEGLDPPPTEFWARVLFELMHVIAHSMIFGVQTFLIEAALRRASPAETVRPPAAPVIALIVALGLGQEILQSLLRHQVTVFGSAFDLAVDGSAAALAAWVWWISRTRRPLSFNPVNRSLKP